MKSFWNKPIIPYPAGHYSTPKQWSWFLAAALAFGTVIVTPTLLSESSNPTAQRIGDWFTDRLGGADPVRRVFNDAESQFRDSRGKAITIESTRPTENLPRVRITVTPIQ